MANAGNAKGQLNELAFLKNGRGGRTRTRNHRFWRPLFYQLELRPCNKRGVVYKAGFKGKGFFSHFRCDRTNDEQIPAIPTRSGGKLLYLQP